MSGNFLLEVIPLVLFFIAYYIGHNLFLATGICIVVSWAVLIFIRLRYKHIAKNTWISTILITIFGGLTIILHNKTFVMLKPTVLYWIFALSLFVAQLNGRNLVKLALHKEVKISDQVWNKISLSWSIFFILLGILNLVVALNFSEYQWVKFKTFGCTSLMFIFMLINVFIVYKIQNKQSK